MVINFTAFFFSWPMYSANGTTKELAVRSNERYQVLLDVYSQHRCYLWCGNKLHKVICKQIDRKCWSLASQTIYFPSDCIHRFDFTVTKHKLKLAASDISAFFAEKQKKKKMESPISTPCRPIPSRLLFCCKVFAFSLHYLEWVESYSCS